MKISRPVLVNSLLAVLVLAALVGGYFVIANPFAETASSSASRLTGTVLAGTVSSSVTASGSIAAVNTVAASFAVSGVIATVNTTLGATVAAGDVLGTLDTTDLAKALTKAKTTLANARSSLSDANTSLAAADASGSGGSSSQTNSAKQQVTSAQSSVTDAINAVATAQSNLDSCTLTAPIAGLVVAVDGSVGADTSGKSSTTSTSTSFVTIADVAQMTMTASIAEADIASVSVGQAASVTFPALSGVTATAKVSAVSPVATASNSVVTYATTISLDAIPAGLRLGQTAEVSIITASSKADALHVPTAAVTTANGTSTVKVVASGKTSIKTVILGIIGDTGTEIKSGLTAGQIVVIGTVAATTTGTTGTGSTGLGAGGGARFGGGTPPTGGNR